MKIIQVTKIIITVLFTAILFISLSGCNKKTEFLPYDGQHNNEQIIENNQIIMPNVSYNNNVPLEIMNNYENNFKNEIIHLIRESKTITKEHEMYQYYAYNKISDITEFYFPTIKIDGYELYRILIDQWTCIYYYAPIKELKKESEYVFTFETGILLGINRPYWLDNADPLKPEIENREIQNIEYLFKDDLLYTQSQNSIMGLIGNTSFNIYVPNKLNNYEFLHELGLKISETSEMIVVDK